MRQSGTYSWHSDDHVVEIWVECLAFGNIHSEWRFVMIPSQNVVDVVGSSWSHSEFGLVNRPSSSVGVLRLYFRPRSKPQNT